MGKCVTCGNDYDETFEVTTASGERHVFDSIECAVPVIAPVCVNCGTRVLGHGVQNEQHMFCCAHCAQAVGVTGVHDRVTSGS
ncbi:hypothetical protein ACFX43_20500 [Nocardioides sp. YIM B13467]|uniref:hypothetical protein n=1 Tax=Nocardioides sp. YIM B13467 TaxID=3366294 RepID=UPI00366C568A